MGHPCEENIEGRVGSSLKLTQVTILLCFLEYLFLFSLPSHEWRGEGCINGIRLLEEIVVAMVATIGKVVPDRQCHQ